jgi:hypothetical protein
MTVMPCPQCEEYIEDNVFGTQCKHCGYTVGDGTRMPAANVGAWNMTATISTERSHPSSFAVMLRNAPPFPDGKDTKPIDVQPLAVIAANDDGGKWGWASLDQEEKNIVGDALVAYGAGVDTWYWCLLLNSPINYKLKKA